MNRNRFAVVLVIAIMMIQTGFSEAATEPSAKQMNVSVQSVFPGIEHLAQLKPASVDENLFKMLIHSDLDPKSVNVTCKSGSYTLRVGDREIVAFDEGAAKKLATTGAALANRWSGSLKGLLGNKRTVEQYLIQVVDRSNNENWQRAALFRVAELGAPKLTIEVATKAISKSPNPVLYQSRGFAEFMLAQADYNKLSNAYADERPNLLSDLAATSTAGFDDLLKSKPTGTFSNVTGDLLWLRSIAYSGLGEYDKAMRDLEESRKYNANNTVAFRELINLYFKTNALDRGLLFTENQINSHPNDRIATVARARLLVSKHRFDEAISLMKSAGEPDLSNVDADEYAKCMAKALASENKSQAAHRLIATVTQQRENDLYEGLFAAQLLTDLRCADIDGGLSDIEKMKQIIKNDLGDLGFALAAVNLVGGKYEQVSSRLDATLAADRSNPDNSRYLLILRTIAARAQHDNKRSNELAELAHYKSNSSNEWPQPVLDFLDGSIDKDTLLKKAVGPRQVTEAKCYLGLLQMVTGDKNDAAVNFKWIDENGDADAREYDIARGALSKLSG